MVGCFDKAGHFVRTDFVQTSSESITSTLESAFVGQKLTVITKIQAKEVHFHQAVLTSEEKTAITKYLLPLKLAIWILYYIERKMDNKQTQNLASTSTKCHATTYNA